MNLLRARATTNASAAQPRAVSKDVDWKAAPAIKNSTMVAAAAAQVHREEVAPCRYAEEAEGEERQDHREVQRLARAHGCDNESHDQREVEVGASGPAAAARSGARGSRACQWGSSPGRDRAGAAPPVPARGPFLVVRGGEQRMGDEDRGDEAVQRREVQGALGHLGLRRAGPAPRAARPRGEVAIAIAAAMADCSGGKSSIIIAASTSPKVMNALAAPLAASVQSRFIRRGPCAGPGRRARDPAMSTKMRVVEERREAGCSPRSARSRSPRSRSR